jgi:hypothetical protein
MSKCNKKINWGWKCNNQQFLNEFFYHLQKLVNKSVVNSLKNHTDEIWCVCAQIIFIWDCAYNRILRQKDTWLILKKIKNPTFTQTVFFFLPKQKNYCLK